MYDIEWALQKINELKTHKKLSLNLSYTTFLEGNRVSSFRYDRSIADPLTSFPAEIKDLEFITTLNLTNNCITEIPEWVCGLINLEELIIKNNNLTSIPGNISKLQRLKILDVRGNKIAKLPRSIIQLDSSIKLLVDHNPIENPPIEIAVKGIDSIKKYFQQLDSQGLDYLYEAKLLIVGEGGAGKTTLTKKIQNPKYVLKKEDPTKGIDVYKWNFKLPTGNSFQVNIWDFGGQEIYHRTHQFFLSKRSLYLLVADSRNDDTDFYYWLSIVELLSDKSPILIVKNEKNEIIRLIDESELRGRFENIKDILSTNLATNRGLLQLFDGIKYFIGHLPHIGTPLPKKWLQVRQKLENDKRNYIYFMEFLDICQENGFELLEDKMLLSGYLHDLGVFLHFQDDPILNKIVILKPHWATKAVYQVLENETIVYKHGHFRKEILRTIWTDVEYDGLHDELLELMQRFSLCYLIPGTADLYIIPQLLLPNQPEYNWFDTDNLTLRYKYDFLPKNIITLFIVIMHKYIFKQEIVWRNGVVLQKDKTLAEIICYHDKREIRVRLYGKNKWKLMEIIRYEFEKIHNNYSKIIFDELIPCNCSVCAKLQEPHYYSYNILQQFLDDKQEFISCYKSYQNVRVKGLLMGSQNDLGVVMGNNAQVGNGNVNKQNNIKITVENGANVGDILINNSLQKSKNKVAYSEMNPELRDLLQQLIVAVDEMNKHQTEGQVNETRKDLEHLVEEITSKEPKAKWYRVSLEGLTKAAKNLGEIGKPVIMLAAKIAEMLM